MSIKSFLFINLLFLNISFSFCYLDENKYEEIKSKATFEVLDYEVHKEIFKDYNPGTFTKQSIEEVFSPEALIKYHQVNNTTESITFLDDDEIINSLPNE